MIICYRKPFLDSVDLVPKLENTQKVMKKFFWIISSQRLTIFLKIL